MILIDSCIKHLVRHHLDKKALKLALLHRFLQDLDCRKVVGLSKAHTAEHPYNKSQRDRYVQL